MIVKRLLCPERVRRVPEQFSWVDHRLVRDKHIGRCGPEALAAVARNRHELIAAGLIAYQKPLYQVLSLEPRPCPPVDSARGNRCGSIGEVLRAALGGGA